jgi:hypothetical protein
MLQPSQTGHSALFERADKYAGFEVAWLIRIQPPEAIQNVI